MPTRYPEWTTLLMHFKVAVFFFTVDLANGYWQLELEEEDRVKSAFASPLGLFEFNVLSMGVSNGPATFQRVMEKVLEDLLLSSSSPITRVFFDDVAVGGSNTSGHVTMLGKCFQCLRSAGLKLKLSKCKFMQREVEFLGFTLSSQGVSTCPDKVSKVRELQIPKSATDVKQFLGLTGYYRKFIRKYSKVVCPLEILTSGKGRFYWDKACQVSFRLLKERLTTALF